MQWRECADDCPRLQVFSALDILDYILQLFFWKHMEGLSRLYRCQLQRQQLVRNIVKNMHAWSLKRYRANKRMKWKNQTSMLVAFSFSSITCFRMVRDDLMASFNVIDCLFKREKRGLKQEVMLDMEHRCWVYLVVDLLQGALCPLWSRANGPSITLNESSWWVHVVPTVREKGVCDVETKFKWKPDQLPLRVEE